MEEIDCTKDIPNKPPEGVVKWLREKGYFEQQYILYRADWEYDPLSERKVRVVRCHCSECEREYTQPYMPVDVCCSRAYTPVRFGFLNETYAANVFTGDKTQCPICGAKAEAIHVGQFRNNFIIESVYPMTVHNINGHAVLLQWRVEYKLNKQGNTFITTSPQDGGIILDKKIIRICGYMNWGLGAVSYYDEWQQRKRFSDCIGEVHTDLIYPFPADVFNGTNMENSKFAEYINALRCSVTFPLSYLYLYLRHKNVENLITSGMAKLVNRAMDSARCYGGSPRINDIKIFDWKQCKPNLMLGLTKEEFRFAKKKKWGKDEIAFFQKAKEHGVKPEDVAACDKRGFFDIERLIDRKAPIMKTINYLNKQCKKFHTTLPTVYYICDYWDMAKKNGKDMTDENVLYPHNLVNRHDVENLLCEKEKTKAANAKFKKRLAELNKYCFAYNGLSIHPAHSADEMITEGAKLQHCVGTYVNKHANGKTTLFFIRHTDHPRTPYFTLEFDIKTGKVLQNRGLKNCARTPEVKEFEEKWLEFVDTINKKKKRKAA